MKMRNQVVLGLVWLGLITVAVLGQVDSAMAGPATVQASGQDDIASARVDPQISGNVHAPNVTMKGLPGHVTTDSSGRYVARVPYNWVGTITPEKRGMTFDPSSRSLNRVKGNLDALDFDVVAMNTRMISSNPEVLVVPTAEVKPSQFAAIQQDMRVMLHILKKAVQDEKNPLVGGVFSQYGNLLGRNDASLQSLYIQGYGALFFVQASFPLEWSSEPVQAVGPEDNDEPSADPVWQQAKKQVFNPAAQTHQAKSSRGDTEAMMRTLMEGLKHAANIRYLSPEESVTVIVRSGSEAPVMFGMSVGSGGGGYGGGGASGAVAGGVIGGDMYGGAGRDAYGYGEMRASGGRRVGRSSGFAASSGQTTARAVGQSAITFQVSKARIDDFAVGKMGLDDFIKDVNIIGF